MILIQGKIDSFNPSFHFKRIISLVPSITWLLYDYKLASNLIAVTKFCEIPEQFNSTTIRIGGTKNPDLDKIRLLKPDLIIANKEENNKPDVEALSKDSVVYLSDIFDLDSMYQMMAELGILTGMSNIANQWIQNIKDRYNLFKSNALFPHKFNIVYLIWRAPYMTVGRDTFIHYMLLQAGFVNIFSEYQRYPQINLNDIQFRNPDAIFLSSEPYPFKHHHQIEFLPIKSTLVDGRMFSWYGTYTIRSFDYLNALKQSLNNNL
ncbi:MAG: ABC transporter substrate-binding protein [Saprospiraceae bacterium]|nr:ABC transporter substrate-binding protein [Saprospiraceae bacterium]MBK9721579.1 ABC transporter substrate-binding protein [Saprospiraceae bacterium]